MDARAGAEAPAPSRRSPAVTRRQATCIWLARLASLRAGVVQYLVRQCDGTLGDVLDCEPGELVAMLARRGSAADESEEREKEHGDAHQYRRLLALGPLETQCGGAESAADLRAAVCWGEAGYPSALLQLHDPPPALFVRAAAPATALAAVARRPVIAVVGARRPSAYGLEIATSIAADLARLGAVIVSGMALGIDAAAQAEALRLVAGSEAPATVGVLGCGADVIYPRANARLFAGVEHHGLLLSEFWWGVPARAWRFPARNRVIAGISDGVVIVEGSERSGSLITARYALDQGRDVFAVPGEAGRRLSAGPHRLLREGAHLCESAADVVAVVGPQLREGVAFLPAPGAGAPAQPLPGTDRNLALLAALDDGEQTVDQLARSSGSTVAETLSLLSTLELEGLVCAAPGGRFRRRRG
jgi:DNA processing protein